jgi:hypothetical protein
MLSKRVFPKGLVKNVIVITSCVLQKQVYEYALYIEREKGAAVQMPPRLTTTNSCQGAEATVAVIDVVQRSKNGLMHYTSVHYI